MEEQKKINSKNNKNKQPKQAKQDGNNHAKDKKEKTPETHKMKSKKISQTYIKSNSELVLNLTFFYF
jgi:hypothetical protein